MCVLSAPMHRKDVHKSPALDLVGWFTITPPSGPTPAQLPLHRQILEHYNEAALILAFHASELQNTSSTIGKLPLTIYESVHEEDGPEDGDKSMDIDGQAHQLTLRFRELPYSIETGEAEMISVDFVASGGGNATAIDAKGETSLTGRLAKSQKQGSLGVGTLSREDEDLIANLTMRLDAVKTLESRLHLIKSYLESTLSSTSDNGPPSTPHLSNSLLRSIYSLITHLALLNPRSSNSFSVESLAQANDVLLVALLGSMGKSVRGMRELGKKVAIANSIRQSAAREVQHPLDSQSPQHGFMRERGKEGSALWG
ncbi:conserved hypothetical protein [Uncinocarpus reesii 1704]|uniref:EIF3F/CSN6-like C-terminal domain-containing protein n=1 Tax=Uncinocarpus reesii (strain UAMH 1704) TaxID=336963 RepID=C4JN96_UNCRE|nr:uncharacterized protein UREG_04302 [Uncinocarpus reesii 1704]EEP79456.1 conserved hypothetical protein [Uncinocarpus reesii 1704]